ncbi:DUF3768 domain-containing protein [Phaeobacter inhibens]|uniref:DUF3768 domain-containing protein n=1 Tax=Phaeobacter inhibens TaxID=221822 RepID=UPI0021A46BDC|nr:DUF3768 domain-containing protein [Phaeobacter inhibens]UWR62781.1 DUF3768 domain-containing protein [Phaeobacter inhibens]
MAQTAIEEEYSVDVKLLAQQNDAFRAVFPAPQNAGRWFHTQSVAAMGPTFVLKAYAAIGSYDDFNTDIDPYGDHAMGKFTIDGETVWFKIDCYDVDYRYGSDQPDNPEMTRRVLTVMLSRDL